MPDIDDLYNQIEHLQYIIDENNNTIIELQEEIKIWQDKYYSLLSKTPYEIRVIAHDEGII